MELWQSLNNWNLVKKKQLKARLGFLEKKCAVLELIVKWQSLKLEAKREARIKQEKKGIL